MARTPGATTAALFDLRSIIAVMFGFYGIVLVVVGAVGESQEELDKAGGIDINLWSGIAMTLLAVGFGLWVWLRPPVPPSSQEMAEAPDGPPAH